MEMMANKDLISEYNNIIMKKGLDSLSINEIINYKNELKKELASLKDKANFYKRNFVYSWIFLWMTSGMLFGSYYQGDVKPSILLLETAAVVGSTFFSTVSYDLYKEKEKEANRVQKDLEIAEEKSDSVHKL